VWDYRRRTARFLGALAVLAWAGCSSSSSSGGGSTGIGGTGTSSGTATSTGSVTVAGTTYDTDAAEVVRDDQPAAAGEFFVGEKLRVEGTRSDESGTATRVVFDDDLEGPVSAIVPVECDLPCANLGAVPRVSELTILGQTVRMTRGLTVFAGGIDFDGIALDTDLVEVSGFRGEAGRITATLLRRTATLMPGAMPAVELRGTVESLQAGSFEIACSESPPPAGCPILVEFDATTEAVGFPPVADPLGELMEGDFVEVGGTFDDAADTVDTRGGGRIELEGEGFEGSLEDLQVEGTVSEFSDPTVDFRVDGQLVDGNPNRLGVVYEPNEAVVQSGLRVEVEGSLEDGVLIAKVVRYREPEVRIAAEIAPDAVDTDAGTLLLLGDVTVEAIDGTTRYDGVSGLDDLAAGDFVTVWGVRVRDRIRASTITLEATTGQVELRGRTAGVSPPRFDVAGAAVRVDGATVFENLPMNLPDPIDDFFQYITVVNPGVLVDVRETDDGDPTTLTDAERVILLE
jgi:hypothetical protein